MKRTRTPAGAPAPLPIDVVSIMSQVVYGHVGNSVAVPALQRFGLNVAAVPTVVLSNTPHYPTLHGGALPLDWFEGYLDDLLARDALYRARAVVVGFLGDAGQARALGHWLDRARRTRPDLTVIVDPVIGDHDHGIYVDPALVDAYRDHLARRARGLTPNGFELAQLTGLPVDGIDEAARAARTLLVGTTEWVAVTSAAPATWTGDEMKILVVTRTDETVIAHPRLDLAPKGTGDLFTAALTARLLGGAPVAEAARRAGADVVRAMLRTRQAHCAELLLPPPGWPDS